MGIVLLVLLLVFLFFVLLSATALPFMSLVSVIKDNDLTANKKVFWVLGMFLLWPFIPLLYGAMYVENKLIRYSSRGCFASLAIFFIGVMALMPYVKNLSQNELKTTLSNKNLKFDDGVEARFQTEFKENVSGLMGAIDSVGLFPNRQTLVLMRLVELLQVYSKDNLLTQKEMANWSQKYQNRESLNETELKKDILAAKEEAAQSGQKQEAIKQTY